MANNWNNYSTTLELVEEIATYENWISSEDQLSEKFDTDIAPDIIKGMGVEYIAKYGVDKPMLTEAFNNWSDSLCKDGTIHAEQYNNYSYIGEWSE